MTCLSESVNGENVCPPPDTLLTLPVSGYDFLLIAAVGLLLILVGVLVWSVATVEGR